MKESLSQNLVGETTAEFEIEGLTKLIEAFIAEVWVDYLKHSSQIIVSNYDLWYCLETIPSSLFDCNQTVTKL